MSILPGGGGFENKLALASTGIGGAAAGKAYFDKKNEKRIADIKANRELLQEKKLAPQVYVKKQAELQEPMDIVNADLKHFVHSQQYQASIAKKTGEKIYHNRLMEEAKQVSNQLDNVDFAFLKCGPFESINVGIKANSKLHLEKKLDPFKRVSIQYDSDDFVGWEPQQVACDTSQNNISSTIVEVEPTFVDNQINCETSYFEPAIVDSSLKNFNDRLATINDFRSFSVGVCPNEPLIITKQSRLLTFDFWANACVIVVILIGSYQTIYKSLIFFKNFTRQRQNTFYQISSDSVVGILLLYKEKKISKNEAILSLCLDYNLTTKAANLVLEDKLEINEDVFKDPTFFNKR